MLSLRTKYKYNSTASFTLVELLIVIAILAILAAAIVVVINPSEILAQARDSVRLREIGLLNRAITLLQTNCPECSLGLPNVIYVSIPSDFSNCANLGLPPLPHPWIYSCVTSLNSRNINGTGWIPVNFTAFPGSPPVVSLPVDPVNSSLNGQFYIYTTEAGRWKLTSLFESERHARVMNTDGGPDTALYEVGSNLNIANFQRGLVGNWGFNEGTGTTALDASGTGNTGTLQLGTLGNTSTANAWVTGMVGGALSFDGEDDRVEIGHRPSLHISRAVTQEAWVNPSSFTETGTITRSGLSTDLQYLMLVTTDRRLQFLWWDGALRNIQTDANLIPLNQWTHIVAVRDNAHFITLYINGVLRGSGQATQETGGGGQVNIGSSQPGTEVRDFHGLIDEVRIYNRVLSASEIRANFNAGR